MGINRAMYALADVALQGDTTNIRTIGAAHRQHIGPGFQRQFGRHALGIFRLCFSPVKSNAKRGTTGAALLAGMDHAYMITQTKKRRVDDTPFLAYTKSKSYLISNSTVCAGVLFRETSTLYLPVGHAVLLANLKLVVASPSGEICVPSSCTTWPSW